MPVNRDPKKRRGIEPKDPQDQTHPEEAADAKAKDPFCETDLDREKALADAESKNLWDATEVIDMDTW